MKCVFFMIFLAAALMQVNSSASKDSKRNSSAKSSNPLEMPSSTEQIPAAIQTLDLQSLISSVTKLGPSVIDKSLPHLKDLGKILPTNSPLGSMIRGLQFLLENQQMLKTFDSTLAVLNNHPTGANGLNNADDNVFLKTATGSPNRKRKEERVANKTSRASGLPDNVKIEHNSVKGPDAEMNKRKRLLLQNKDTLLKNRDTSDIEFISTSEAHRTNTSRNNRGYLVHYGSDGKIWRTKNTDLIIDMVYDHDFSMIPSEDDGYTTYVSADGTVSFTQYGNRTHKTQVHLRD